MSTAAKLCEAREHVRTIAEVQGEVFRSAPMSREEFDVLVDSANTQEAAESIAQAKSLFTTRHTRNQIKFAYNSLSVRQKGMCCIAGGLSPQDCYKSYEEFNDIELQKIRRGLQELSAITRRFDRTVGGISKLRAADFH